VKTRNNISFTFIRICLVAGLYSTYATSNAQNALCYKDVNNFRCIYDSVVYSEGWHHLPQTKFWQQIMLLTPDSALVNVAESRQVLDKIAIKEWNKLSEEEQNCYRTDLRSKYNIIDSTPVYVTIGKKDFYQFQKAVPSIGKSIQIFEKNGVDPWYAQAILLIESPGKTNTKSIVGANGPFQLMKSVAKQEGLIVNKSIDERTDIEKSALAASRLLKRICIPKVCSMLDSAHIPYKQTDMWFRLLVLHAYHAGAGNVYGVIKKINPCEGGMELMQTVWKTTYKGFKNSSQNYSQLALAAFCNFHEMVLEQQIVIPPPSTSDKELNN
jgi:hypothetical protein